MIFHKRKQNPSGKRMPTMRQTPILQVVPVSEFSQNLEDKMTDTPVRECFECGTHWPEDVMKKGSDDNWYCQECYWEPEILNSPDCMEVAHAYREDHGTN